MAPLNSSGNSDLMQHVLNSLSRIIQGLFLWIEANSGIVSISVLGTYLYGKGYLRLKGQELRLYMGFGALVSSVGTANIVYYFGLDIERWKLAASLGLGIGCYHWWGLGQSYLRKKLGLERRKE